MSSRFSLKPAARRSTPTALAAAALAISGVGAGAASAHGRVAATVVVSPPPSLVQTGFPVTFSGTVSPAYVGERVGLQRLRRDGRWRAIAIGYVVASNGGFSITHVFVRISRGVPTTLRIKVPGNPLSVRAFSAPFAITIVRSIPRPRPPHVRLHERRRRVAERRRLRREQREARRLHHRQVVEERRRHRLQAAEERRRHHQQVVEERRRRHQQKLEERRRRREEKRRLHEQKHKLRSGHGARSHRG